MCDRDTETEIERGRDREIKRETGRENEKAMPRQKGRVRVWGDRFLRAPPQCLRSTHSVPCRW